MAPSDLIDHILKRYHDVHRVQLPELIRMARRVEAVHRDNPLTPAGLADALQAMEQELLAHMHKEEAVLFPMLRTGGNAFVPQPIAMMRLEHLEHGETLERHDCLLWLAGCFFSGADVLFRPILWGALECFLS